MLLPKNLELKAKTRVRAAMAPLRTIHQFTPELQQSYNTMLDAYEVLATMDICIMVTEVVEELVARGDTP